MSRNLRLFIVIFIGAPLLALVIAMVLSGCASQQTVEIKCPKGPAPTGIGQFIKGVRSCVEGTKS